MYKEIPLVNWHFGDGIYSDVVVSYVESGVYIVNLMGGKRS